MTDPAATDAREGEGSGGAGAPPQLNRERGFTPREQDELRGLFYVVVSTIAYGSLPILAKLAFATGVRTSGLLAWRFAVACVLFSLLARRAPSLALGTRLTLWGLGVIFVANTVCYFGALQTIPASTASLIFYAYPVIVTLLSAALGLDRLTVRSVAAAIMAVSGCALTAGAVAGSPRGIALALATAFIYAAYVMLGSRFAAGIPSETVSLHVTQACALIFLPWALLRGGLVLPPVPAAWGIVAVMAVFCTVVPIRAFLAGLARVGPARAAVVSSLEVLVTIGLAAAFLHERIGPRQWIGGALILGGVLLPNLGALRRMSAGRARVSRPDHPAV
jgi:drug/metabolite transporter (DMT)-like permease